MTTFQSMDQIYITLTFQTNLPRLPLSGVKVKLPPAALSAWA